MTPPRGPRTKGVAAADPEEGHLMLLIIGIVLLVLWLLGFLAFHVTVWGIHLLLVIGAILLLVHLLGGRRTVI